MFLDGWQFNGVTSRNSISVAGERSYEIRAVGREVGRLRKSLQEAVITTREYSRTNSSVMFSAVASFLDWSFNTAGPETSTKLLWMRLRSPISCRAAREVQLQQARFGGKLETKRLDLRI